MNAGKERYFSLKTRSGCGHIIALLLSIILVCSFFAALLSSSGGRIKIEKILFDVRGATLAGELYYPASTTDEDSYPAVIAVPGAGVTNYNMRSFAEELAKRGYVVFNMNAYGSGQSETPVYNENDQGKDAYNIFGTPMGALDAVNYLRSVEFVDETNIGLIGHSQGSRRAGYAALMDCGYYSFNDIMLNVLFDTFGVAIAEADLVVNADDIAQADLTKDQLAHYHGLRAEYLADYNAMSKSICLIGSTAQFVNPTAQVTVAGIEVTRTCKVNMAIINGTYDYGYLSFNNADETKAAWYIEPSQAIVQGGYYSVDDLTQTGALVGTFRQDTVNSNAALRDAIANRSLRIVLQTRETHSKNFFSSQTSAMAVDYFNQTLNHNADVLSTSKSSITFIWRELLNCIAMFAMLTMLFPIIGLMLTRSKYSGCAAEGETISPERNLKLAILIIGVATIVLNFVAIYNTNGNKNLIPLSFSPFFPLMLTSWAPIQLLIWMIAFAVLILIVYLICTSGYRSFLDYLYRNFSIGAINILKSAVISILFIVCGYVSLSIIQYLFFQDYRFWMVAFSTMKADHWFIAARYLLILVPLYFLNSVILNYFSDVSLKGLSRTKDILITVFVNSLGIWACCAVSNVMAYGGLKTDGLFSSFILTYGTILFVPITVFIARKTYLMTKTVWTGVFANSILLAWLLVSVSGTNGAYVPQNWLSNFLGG